MCQKDLRETIIAAGRTPEMFYRDTPQLLEILDNIEKFNADIKKMSELSMCKKQAD